MIKINEVGLGILPLSLWAIPGIVAYLPTVEAGIVRVSSPPWHHPLWPPRPRQLVSVWLLDRSIGTGVLFMDGGVLVELYCC